MDAMLEASVKVNDARTRIREMADTMVYVKDGLCEEENEVQNNAFWHFIHDLERIAEDLDDITAFLRKEEGRQVTEVISDFSSREVR